MNLSKREVGMFILALFAVLVATSSFYDWVKMSAERPHVQQHASVTNSTDWRLDYTAVVKLDDLKRYPIQLLITTFVPNEFTAATKLLVPSPEFGCRLLTVRNLGPGLQNLRVGEYAGVLAIITLNKQMGKETAQVSTHHVLQTLWSIDVVISVGIAWGNLYHKQNISIGEVLVAKDAVCINSFKFKDGDVSAQQDGMSTIYNPAEFPFFDPVGPEYQKRYGVRAFFGTLLGAPALYSDCNVTHQYLSQYKHKKLIGGDFEVCAFENLKQYNQLYLPSGRNPPVYHFVKGVSDHAGCGEDKDQTFDYQVPAAYNASLYVYTAIQHSHAHLNLSARPNAPVLGDWGTTRNQTPNVHGHFNMSTCIMAMAKEKRKGEETGYSLERLLAAILRIPGYIALDLRFGGAIVADTQFSALFTGVAGVAVGFLIGCLYRMSAAFQNNMMPL